MKKIVYGVVAVATVPFWFGWGIYLCVGGHPFPWNQPKDQQ